MLYVYDFFYIIEISLFNYHGIGELMEPDKLKKILIVDDELLIASSEKYNLEEYGYSVDITNSGESAVDLFQKSNDIDLILMDIDLGDGMDGTTAAEKILQQQDIPIVFLSSHSDKSVVEKTEKITSYGYVVKNSNITVIDASIKMAFKLFEANEKNKQKEIELFKSEKQLRHVLENTRDLAYQLNLVTGTYDYFSPVSTSVLGFTYEEFIEMGIENVTNRFHPDDREQYQNHFNSITQNDPQIDPNIEYRWKHKDGTYHWYSDNRNIIYDENGKPTAIIGNVRDISDKKFINEKMRIKEKEFRTIFENIIDGILLVDKKLKVVNVNEAFTRVTGIKKDEVVGKSGLLLAKKFVNLRDLPKIIKLMKNKLLDIPTDIVNFRIGEKFIEVRTSRKEEDGSYIVLLKDITKQKTAEEILLEKESEYKTIFENTGTASVILNEDTTIMLANNEFEKLSGLPKVEIEGKKRWVDFVVAEDLEWMRKQHNLRRKNSESALNHYEFRFIDNNKQIHHIFLTVSVIPGTKKSIASLLDITDRKNAEKLLTEKESYYRALFENTGTASIIVAKDKTILKVNNEFTVQTGYSKEFMEGKHKWTEFIVPEDLDKMIEQHNLRREKPGEALKSYEFRFISYWGTAKDVFLKIEMIPGTEKSIASFLDISERIKTEKENKRLLEEKNILLKEVHHRIKNNLNVVRSILSLQAKSLNNPIVDSAFNDAKGRIDSIIILYDKLFESESYKKVSTKHYFTDLIDDIFKIFPVVNNIQVDIKIDDFKMDAKKISALGIITNELLTNTLKYAFPLQKKGKVDIGLKRKNEKLEFIYRDNGIGIHDIENHKGFGLSLINIFVNQFHGDIDVNTEHGVSYKIELDL